MFREEDVNQEAGGVLELIKSIKTLRLIKLQSKNG